VSPRRATPRARTAAKRFAAPTSLLPRCSSAATFGSLLAALPLIVRSGRLVRLGGGDRIQAEAAAGWRLPWWRAGMGSAVCRPPSRASSCFMMRAVVVFIDDRPIL
jgi:hypothetical protein